MTVRTYTRSRTRLAQPWFTLSVPNVKRNRYGPREWIRLVGLPSTPFEDSGRATLFKVAAGLGTQG
jgi:hypothetical protein